MATNNESKFFQRLRRTFSGDAVIRRVGKHQYRVFDVNQLQQRVGLDSNNLLKDRYSRGYMASGLYNLLNQQYSSQILKQNLYADYEMMDTDNIVGPALDILAEECVTHTRMKQLLTITTPDPQIKSLLHNLYYDIVNIESKLFSWVRETCKYGDFYLFVHEVERLGVRTVYPLSPYCVQRIDDFERGEVYFQYDQNSDPYGFQLPFREKYFNHEILHFRLLANNSFLPHGQSYLEPARISWKQLKLMKDAMLAHRVTRSGDRRMYFVNIGSLQGTDVDLTIQDLIDRTKKTPYVDPQTQEYNLRYNIQNIFEDVYLPIRPGDVESRVENLPGLEFGSVEDIELLEQDVFRALKIPKSFYGDASDVSGKATLSQVDIRFGRTVQRIQSMIVEQLYKLGIIHLLSHGFSDSEVVNFELSMNPPSVIYEQEIIAEFNEKANLASKLIESNLYPTDYIYEVILGHNEEEYAEFRDLIVEDKKRFFRWNQIENEGNDPTETGESYGTPHDLAAIYHNNDIISQSGQEATPENSNVEKIPVGRPKEKASIYSTDNDNFGRDPLAKHDIARSMKISSDYRPTLREGKVVGVTNIDFTKKKKIDEYDIFTIDNLLESDSDEYQT